MAQWLRLHTPNAGDPGSIPCQGPRSHMPQLRVCMPRLKSLHATTKKIPSATAKTWYSHINIFKKERNPTKGWSLVHSNMQM